VSQQATSKLVLLVRRCGYRPGELVQIIEQVP